MSTYRCLKILYVADPAQATRNRRLAKNDLGFALTRIHIDEWMHIEPLNGTHVHLHTPNEMTTGRTEVKVYIQEWVGSTLAYKQTLLK